MKQHLFKLLWVCGMVLLTGGCRSLFSSSQSTTVSHWHSFDEASDAFAQISPHKTSVADLKALHFHPELSPNVKILTYVDVIQIFIPQPAIHLEDLAPGVRECIDAKESGHAFLVELDNTHDVRHGNLFLDIFGFKRNTHKSGWRFKGLILIKDDLVVYKLSSGQPQISQEDKKVKPLGPLQELDSALGSSISSLAK